VNEFEKFVMHVRNLQKEKVSTATFDVEFLCRMLEDVPVAQKRTVNNNIVGDGGKFSDE